MTLKVFDDCLNKLETHVLEQSNQASFVHSRWFVDHHIRIVERVAIELAAGYEHVDLDLIRAMTWIHDYGKIHGRREADEVNVMAVTHALRGAGFGDKMVREVQHCLHDFNRSSSMDLRTTRLETQIVSSADGCAHLIGPFMFLYWYENPSSSIEDLLEENRRKLQFDWDRKIVLPEARSLFREQRAALLRMLSGDLPARRIDTRPSSAVEPTSCEK